MNGYIIEMTRPDEKARLGHKAVRWIGIRPSAKSMIGVLEGHSPSVIDRGPAVLSRARAMGLEAGEVRQIRD